MSDLIVTPNEQLIIDLGFVAGMFWSQKNLKTWFTHPLSSSFNGLITGSIASYGSYIIAINLPKKVQPYFGGLLVASSLYYLYKQYKNEDVPVNAPLININISTNRS